MDVKRIESYKCRDYFRTKLQKLHSTNIFFKTISIFLFVSINKKHPDFCNLSHVIMLYNDEYDQKGENDSFVRDNNAKSLYSE